MNFFIMETRYQYQLVCSKVDTCPTLVTTHNECGPAAVDYGRVSNVFLITLHTGNCHSSLYAIFLSSIRYLGCPYQLGARDMHMSI
jgi:hypothetical protein